VKLRVDGTRCTGHGRCYALAPEVYAPDEEGYNDARDTTFLVPGELQAGAVRGLRACPEGAIELVDEPRP